MRRQSVTFNRHGERLCSPPEGEATDMETGEQVGFENAVRQMQRALSHRLKGLEEERSETADEVKRRELTVRMAEVEHLLGVLKTLHR